MSLIDVVTRAIDELLESDWVIQDVRDVVLEALTADGPVILLPDEVVKVADLKATMEVFATTLREGEWWNESDLLDWIVDAARAIDDVVE